MASFKSYERRAPYRNVSQNMELEELYALSCRFAPPEIDLRQAQIIDDYGHEDYAKMPINHQKPDDVRREEFDYYGWIYPFMKPKDLLFYLYAVVRECQKDMNLDWLDSYMYSMDREVNGLMDILSEKE